VPERAFDTTTLGEMLLRLSVPAGRRLETTGQLDLNAAGADANLVQALARLGRRTRWMGALPANPLGRLAANNLRAAGVDTRAISWDTRPTARMGTYYVEFSVPPRGIQVVYDRAHSSAAQMGPGDVDWDALLDTRLLHLTGITPALSPACRALVEEAVRRARAAGVPLSFDINFRAKLWTAEAARATLEPLVQGAELLFCSQADAQRVFRLVGEADALAQALLKGSGAKHVIMSSGAQGARLWNGQQWLHRPARPTVILDRLGAGDALAAGVIDGWLDGDLATGLRYGVTLAALCLSQHGDAVVTTREEVEGLMEGEGRMVR
jgi:2-dehydro-3-deoxygluconokinase